MHSLRTNVSDDKIAHIIREISHDHKGINFQSFLNLMRSTAMTKFDAVNFDIQEGIKTYNSIENHELYPVSLLIDRAAFQVLFPGKAGSKPSKHDLLSLDPSGNVTEYDLEKLRENFFSLAGRSKSVVFARAEPAMKKRMVTEIQARVHGAITLAIGDGANDTDMITAAHIGVGIAGVEGTAATNASDYAIGTFRMLHRLLFVHGFYSYQRTSKMVCFIFYKASLVAVMMYLFGIFSAFSGQQFFNDPIYQLYNVMYTALPVLFVAVFDKMLPQSTLSDHPEIYRRAKHGAFNPPIFASWILRAFVHGVIIFFIPYAAIGTTNVNHIDGKSNDLWFFSTVCYFITVLAPTFLIIFEMANVTLIHWIGVFISVFTLFLCNWLINLFPSLVPDEYGVVNNIYSSPSFWFLTVLTLSICMLIELAGRGLQREFFPTMIQVYQEILQILTPEERKKQLNPPKPIQHRPSRSDLHKPISESVNGQTAALTVGMDEEKIRQQQLAMSARGSDASLLWQTGIARNGPAPSVSRTGSVSGVGPHVKKNLIRAMLRFRNLTGSQFDSAAQAELQSHDKFNDPKSIADSLAFSASASASTFGPSILLDGIPVNNNNTSSRGRFGSSADHQITRISYIDTSQSANLFANPLHANTVVLPADAHRNTDTLSVNKPGRKSIGQLVEQYDNPSSSTSSTTHTHEPLQPNQIISDEDELKVHDRRVNL